MYDLMLRAILPLLSVLVGFLALSQGWVLVALIAFAATGIGLYDYLQSQWSITRNFPLAGRIRWLGYRLRPFIRAYAVEDDLHGTPYPYEARNLIQSRARGEVNTHPFGTERDVEEGSYHWIGHSIAPDNNCDPKPLRQPQPYQENPTALR